MRGKCEKERERRRGGVRKEREREKAKENCFRKKLIG